MDLSCSRQTLYKQAAAWLLTYRLQGMQAAHEEHAQNWAVYCPFGLTVKQAVILAGDVRLLPWLIRELLRFGVDDIVLLSEDASPSFETALPGIVAKLPKAVTISCVSGLRGAGTGGALHHVRDRLQERFLVCDGASILDFNYARLLADAAVGPALGRIVLRNAPNPVSAGIVLLECGILPALSPVCSLETDILPNLAATGGLMATVAADGFFLDSRMADGMPGAPESLAARFARPALFLDRDGTINRDHGYVGTRDRWEWIDGALDGIRLATEAGWHVFVVTNQSGIARGLYDEAALETLHAWMTDEVRRAGGTIDDIRFCPFHEAAVLPRYRRASPWRKPAPGMILDLLERWDLDPVRCVLVGDQPSDMAAAAAAGIRGRFFDGTNLLAAVGPLVRAQAEWPPAGCGVY